jgi:dynactin complex subunit
MSKTNLTLGERVQLIPFKHKGKTGAVKYIGEIEGKNSGNWVGIELDEAQGDCDGDINGTQIFECRPSHGLFLRPTQVKSLSNPDVSKITDQSSIMRMDESLVSGMENMGSLIGNSPQLDLNQIETNLNQDPTEVRV